MPTQTLGKVKLTPRGAYDPAATYVPLDIVSYGGGSYCVLKNVTGVTPTGDDVNYQLLAESGADGKSPQISTSKTWLVWDTNKGEYVDTGVSAAGEKGDEGAPGKAPIIGENGNWYEWDDASGAYTDTGKPSRGEKGNTGAEGADGADGKDGANGITPTIGENGNWYLGATDTGKPSRGEDGATGATGATGEKGADGKSAYAYAVEGGYTGTETEFSAKLAAEKFANPNALTFTGAVTGSYDGSEAVSVEIPQGGGSEWQTILTGETTVEAVTTVTIPMTASNFDEYRAVIIVGRNTDGTTGDNNTNIWIDGYRCAYYMIGVNYCNYIGTFSISVEPIPETAFLEPNGNSVLGAKKSTVIRWINSPDSGASAGTNSIICPNTNPTGVLRIQFGKAYSGTIKHEVMAR